MRSQPPPGLGILSLPRPGLQDPQTSARRKQGARNVACGGRCREEDRLRKFLRFAEPLEGDVVLDGCLRRFGGEAPPAMPRCGSGPRRDGVDPDAVRRKIQRHGPREALHRPLAGSVGGASGDCLLGQERS